MWRSAFIPAFTSFLALTIWSEAAAEDVRDIAMYDQCADAQCPIFQVVIKHREAAASSRRPAPMMQPNKSNTVVCPVGPTPTTTAPHSATTPPPPAPVSNTKSSEVLSLAYGLYVASDSVECSKTAVVPNSVFRAVIAVIGSVEKTISENSTASGAALSPAQQTMLLFYTTIMQQTHNFECTLNSPTIGNNTGASQ